jgi:hypothetical protein
MKGAFMPRNANDVELIDYIPVIGGREPADVRRRVEVMEQLLEGLFLVPGLNRRFGLDVLLDIVPGIGDLVGAVLGAYLVWEARNLGMSRWSMFRMTWHVGLNALIGIIPGVGTIATYFYRSNTYNLNMIKKHLDKHHPAGAVIEG